MNEQSMQSTCAPARGARWTTDMSAAIGVIGLAVASLLTSAGHAGAAHAAHATTTGFSSLSEVPSHNGLYRASLVPPSDRADRSTSTTWTVRVETAAGAPVGDATLALESWMPENDRVPAARPRVTRYMGDGRYHVEGLRFDRRGWWNVRLQVARPLATDSLAFNLVR